MGLDIAYYGGKGNGGFRAGSYTGYNDWRNRLAELALGMKDRDVWAVEGKVKAFGELIHFSDCEGTLETDTCKKLAKDFRDYAAEIKAKLNLKDNEEDRWFWYLYEQWQEAFESAADGGRVEFR